MTPETERAARQTIAHHSKSFALASRLLGPRLRNQTAVVYSWCRHADDAVDEEQDPAARRTALGRLRGEVDAIYAGVPCAAVADAFGAVVRERAIPRLYADELIAGMAMDVDGHAYGTLEDLFVYAWRVAGVVGAMLAHVFGIDDDRAIVNAVHLGIGMQLTNVCRDVAEDWARGRLYVPDELLAKHGAAALRAQLGRGEIAGAGRAALAASVRELLAIADRYYASGDRGMRALPWRASLAVRGARNLYAAIGSRIARADFDPLAGRASVSGGAKLGLVARALLRSAAAAPAAWTRRAPRIPQVTVELGDVPRL